MSSWTSVTVGVADLDAALSLWIDDFGFEVVSTATGGDPDFLARWALAADDVNREALVRTPGQSHGMIRFVEFNEPDPPVRQGAESFDLCPKNLDIYVDDMPGRVAALKAAGHTFRNENYSEVTAPNGIRFREIHMPAHDDINVVLLQVIGEVRPYSAKGFGGVGPLITIVPDAAAEKRFYRDVIGLSLLSDNILDGPEIEKMIGLPPGAALDVSIWGRAGAPLGEIEIIEYQQTEGKNLYPRARPKSTGILQVSYVTPDLHPVKSRLVKHGIEFSETRSTGGRVIAFSSPAVMNIEVREGGS